MIDHAPFHDRSGHWETALPASAPTRPSCFAPWVFMVIRDLFGDGSAEGDVSRIGCLHETAVDGTCKTGTPTPGTSCGRVHPRRRVVRVPGGARLPRAEIRDVLQAGDDLVLEFDTGTPLTDATLSETAHLLRKLRNTGFSATATGLSSDDKSRLGRREWHR